MSARGKAAAKAPAKAAAKASAKAAAAKAPAKAPAPGKASAPAGAAAAASAVAAAPADPPDEQQEQAVSEKDLTARFIKLRIDAYIGDRLKAMGPAGKELACVKPFDADACVASLNKDRVFECTVSLAAFSMYGFTYANNPPTIGSITRVRDAHVPCVSTGNLTYDKGWQQQPFLVRVPSPHPPTLGKLVPVAQEELRLGLAYAWAEAVRTKDAAAAAVYETMAQSW